MNKLYLSLLLWVCLIISHVTQANTTLSAQDFFTYPDMVLAKINPKGNLIASIRYKNEQQILTLINRETNTERTLIDVKDYAKNNASIKRLVWIDDTNIAVQFVEIKKGLEDLLDTKAVSRLLIVAVSPRNVATTKIYSVRTQGWLVDPLQDEAFKFYYAKSGIYSKVYKLDVRKLLPDKKKVSKLTKIDGGQFKKANQVIEISGYAKRWFVDPAGKIKAVLHYNTPTQLTLSYFDENNDKDDNEDNNKSKHKENKATELITWNFDDSETSKSDEKRFIPISLSPEKNSFYCLDLNEEEQRTVYQVNFLDQSEKIAYQASSFKIIDLVQDPDTQELIGVKVINNGVVENVFIGTSPSKKQLNKTKAPTLVSKVNESLDHQHAIIYQADYNNAGQFFIQSKGKEKRLIGERYPKLNKQLKSKFIKASLNVEGLTIPYLLTLPHNSQQTPYPLIVMPHGGPIGIYDTDYYDAIAQFFNHNNYAVLRVNFRGSSGYSKALQEAGKQQWGKLMLEDIYQASLKVLQRNDINRQQVCAFGLSYGGYAALMLTIKHPEIYRCAASWAGVSDLNLYLNSIRFNKKQQKWLLENIGDSENNYQELKALSPVFLTEQLKTPILIGHGNKDDIVDIEHAYRLKLMLEKHQKSFQWIIDPKANHSFGTYEQRAHFFSQLLSFLNNTIAN